MGAPRRNKTRRRRKQSGFAPIRRQAGIWAGVAALVVIFLAVAQFQRQVYHASIRELTNILLALADAAVIILPYWLLRGRWRLCVLVPVVCIPLFLMANVMYMHHFDDIIPFSAIFSRSRYTERMVDGIPGTFDAGCWLYIVLPVIYTVALLVWHKAVAATSRLSWRWVTAIVAVTMALFGYSQYHGLKGLQQYYQENEFPLSNRSLIAKMYLSYYPPSHMYADVRLPVYLVKSAIGEAFISRRTISYTANEREEIADYLGEMQKLRIQPRPELAANRGKNLVVIVVESLNAEVIDARAGSEEVTPTLNALFHAKGTIAARNVVVQVGSGGSSDGLLLLNTGILPLTDGAYSDRFPGHAMRSLATVAPWRSAVEVICEERTSWSHDIMTRQYGYGHLYDRSDLQGAGLDYLEMGNDAAVLEYAARLARQLEQPFLMEVTTLSMHVPFNEPHIKGSIPEAELADLEPTLRNYYLACRYFDRQLALFIESLKRHGLYDNTVIAIVSDHNTALSDADYNLDSEARTGNIVFLAAGTGITEEVKRTVGQVDVYPTLLEVMGLDPSRCSWGGVGLSMLNPKLTSAVDCHGMVHGIPAPGHEALQRRGWDVSSLILRGNYFGMQSANTK